MAERQLILKDGTIIDGTAGYAQGFLWLYFSGYTLLETAEIFCDAEKTETIEFKSGADDHVYEGFTECRSIMTDADGNLSVCMTKP